MPEFIDPVFTKTSPKRSFSLKRKRAYWLVFAKTGSIISGTGQEAAVGPLGGLPGDVAEDLHDGGDQSLFFFVRGSVDTSPRYATL